MSNTVPVKSLRLEYRLWIAELNYVISLIRIFKDRLTEIAVDDYSVEQNNQFLEFKRKIAYCRTEIDGLSHRMQIEKMNLAHPTDENNQPKSKIQIPENYSEIRNDFYNFRVFFNELKSELLKIEKSFL